MDNTNIRTWTVSLLMAITAGFAAAETATPEVELLVNPRFEAAHADGTPVGWDWRTRGKGYVHTHIDAEPPMVEIGIQEGPEDSFIQQTANLSHLPEGTRHIRLRVVYRYASVQGGERGHQRGQIQARFLRGGREIGPWISLDSFTGTSDGWITRTREVPLRADSDGLMVRLGFYGTRAGQLWVREASAVAVTEALLRSERARFRPSHPYGPAVSDARYGRLRHGVNINDLRIVPDPARSGIQDLAVPVSALSATARLRVRASAGAPQALIENLSIRLLGERTEPQ